jgi:hypothetical protein
MNQIAESRRIALYILIGVLAAVSTLVIAPIL